MSKIKVNTVIDVEALLEESLKSDKEVFITVLKAARKSLVAHVISNESVQDDESYQRVNVAFQILFEEVGV